MGVTEEQLFTIKQLTEMKISAVSQNDLEEDNLLNEWILDMSRIYQADIWISTRDDKVLISSIKGKPPEVQFRHLRRYRDISFYQVGMKEQFIYVKISLEQTGKPAKYLNIRVNRKKAPGSAGPALFFGLLIIMMVSAFFLFLLSRSITNPLKKLRESALQIADGDLDQEVAVKTEDEVGQVGKAFNSMVDTLKRMIVGTKELTANISHELRTPLTRIRVAEELLNEKLSDTDRKKYLTTLESIETEIEEMDSLIGKILLLSKLETAPTNGMVENINLTDICLELVERFRPAFEKKSVTVKISIPDKKVEILGLREDIRTAVSNLLSNAIKFSQDGTSIELSIKKMSNSTELKITNKSEHLTEENLIDIFEPFYSLGPKSEAGTGLGLTITKKIIEKYGGSVKATLDQDRVHFIITFPIPEAV
jgi:two-component system sensor histidine kinase CpxA